MWAVLEQAAVAAPDIFMKVFVVCFVTVVLAFLVALAIALRDTPAGQRPEIIRALAEYMPFWRKKR
ncbi:hypothetical protein [Streptomyces sp. NPDC026589]|uniref:hypothetical protein n=1 Tax=Streptomyces sp. NPDC026589 TaxID=3155609 RepID=UPI003403986B